MILTASLVKYPVKKIKQGLNTQIKELSTDGIYDYLPTPKIKIISPNGKETFYKNKGITATWTTTAWQSLQSVDLYYTYDGGNTLNYIASTKNYATSSYQWDTSRYFDIDLPVTSSYKFVVSGTYDTKPVIDYSNAEFTITTRSLYILDNSVNLVVQGKKNIYPIKWKSRGLSPYITIEAILVPVNENQDTSSIPITSSYKYTDLKTFNWLVPSYPTIQDDTVFFIKMWDSLDSSVWATSSFLLMTNHLIRECSGYKISFPSIQSVNAQGIYNYLEYSIEIKDDIGEVYIPRSFIELSDNVGLPAILPGVKFIRNTDGFILGEKFHISP